MIEKALKVGTEYGTVIRAWLGPKLMIFLTDPNDVEIILSSNIHLDKSTEYKFFKPWLGEGLLIASGMIQIKVIL